MPIINPYYSKGNQRIMMLILRIVVAIFTALLMIRISGSPYTEFSWLWVFAPLWIPGGIVLLIIMGLGLLFLISAGLHQLRKLFTKDENNSDTSGI